MTARPRRCVPRSATPTTPTAWRSIPRRARSCASSASPAGPSTASSPGAAAHGRISLGEAVVYVQSAVGVSMIAFGGFSWALDGSAAPVAAVLRLEPAMRPAGALRSGDRRADGLPAREIRLRDVTFAYPAGAPVVEHFDLTIPVGSSLA